MNKAHRHNINVALDNATYYSNGEVNLHKTADEYNIPFAHREEMKVMIADRRATNYDFKARRVGQGPLPFGPKAQAVISDASFNALKNPVIYEIVCTGSGRRYIGSTITPTLRRSTAGFWLNNHNVPAVGNIFFGVEAVDQDIRKYGVNSFYMDIVEFIPSADRKILAKAAKEYKLSMGNSVYNQSIRQPRVSDKWVFCEETQKAAIEFKNAAEDFNTARATNPDRLKGFRKERMDLSKALKAKQITAEEFRTATLEVTDRWQANIRSLQNKEKKMIATREVHRRIREKTKTTLREQQMSK